MAKKFYAVKNGKNGDGIYDRWEACKAQVHGVKSVVFKGFPTRAEAEDFLDVYKRQGVHRPQGLLRAVLHGPLLQKDRGGPQWGKGSRQEKASQKVNPEKQNKGERCV